MSNDQLKERARARAISLAEELSGELTPLGIQNVLTSALRHFAEAESGNMAVEEVVEEPQVEVSMFEKDMVDDILGDSDEDEKVVEADELQVDPVEDVIQPT